MTARPYDPHEGQDEAGCHPDCTVCRPENDDPEREYEIDMRTRGLL